jgi:hypothetical protein
LIAFKKKVNFPADAENISKSCILRG